MANPARPIFEDLGRIIQDPFFSLGSAGLHIKLSYYYAHAYRVCRRKTKTKGPASLGPYPFKQISEKTIKECNKLYFSLFRECLQKKANMLNSPAEAQVCLALFSKEQASARLLDTLDQYDAAVQGRFRLAPGPEQLNIRLPHYTPAAISAGLKPKASKLSADNEDLYLFHTPLAYCFSELQKAKAKAALNEMEWARNKKQAVPGHTGHSFGKLPLSEDLALLDTVNKLLADNLADKGNSHVGQLWDDTQETVDFIGRFANAIISFSGGLDHSGALINPTDNKHLLLATGENGMADSLQKMLEGFTAKLRSAHPDIKYPESQTNFGLHGTKKLASFFSRSFLARNLMLLQRILLDLLMLEGFTYAAQSNRGYPFY